MKFFKKIALVCLISFVMMSFAQCVSTQKLEKSLPLVFSEVYYQHWIAGIEGGGSGINIFISVSDNPQNIILDSVYFKERRAKLEQRNDSVFIGRFKTDNNQRKEIVISSNRIAEYGNPVPEIHKKSPFELKEDDCVVSYSLNNKRFYYKISDIIRKPVLNYR